MSDYAEYDYQVGECLNPDHITNCSGRSPICNPDLPIKSTDDILKKLQIQSAVRRADYSYLLKEAKQALYQRLANEAVTVYPEVVKDDKRLWMSGAIQAIPLSVLKVLMGVNNET